MKELAILQTITAQTVVGDTKKINITKILQKEYICVTLRKKCCFCEVFGVK